MPRGDRTGPMGMGPRSGRARGYCVGNNEPGYMNNGFGIGRRLHGRFSKFMGCGRGFKRGFGFYNYNGPSKEEIKEYLKNEMNFLKTQVEEIEKRIKELDQEN